MQPGLVQVYTGDGKGKTTAAAGQALRAAGNGLKVGWIAFHKDPSKWGGSELKLLEKVGVDVFCFCPGCRLFDKKMPVKKIRQECLDGWENAKKLINSDEYDLIVLDEINISMQLGYLDTQDVVSVLKAKPSKLEIVLTGRGAPFNIIRTADLVSRIVKVKHPFDKGVTAKKGIDY
jgi:cob(I)alamin adenosyltransferase